MVGLTLRNAFCTLLTAVVTHSSYADNVKLSKSGICHDRTSKWYLKTNNYKPFDTLDECLEVGRLPKGFIQGESKNSIDEGSYDRSLFNHWVDSNGDGLNTRHELLKERSTSIITYSASGTRVLTGKWYDPYTGKTFYSSKELDVDHILSLGWSWPRGSNNFSALKREQFANDSANLILTQSSVNRSKGAKSFTEWQPPLHSYRCQFNIRAHRLVKKYGLVYFPNEERFMKKILTQCGAKY